VSAAGSGVRRATVLGTVTGARTFLAPAALALRGRLGRVAKYTLPVLAAGELVGDKLPSAPPRIEGPGLVGRVVAGAFAGRVSGGNPGLRAGAAFALASAYPSQLLRQNVVKHTPLPDIAFAVPEDLAGIALVTAASAEPTATLPSQDDVDGPKTQDGLEFSARQHGTRHGFVATGALGVGSALVGTAAMTTAQRWVYGFTRGEPSEAPVEVGEKLLGALGIEVKKKHRSALGTVMHLAYGKGWGLPFGLIAARGGRTPRPRDGIALGVGVWLVSLVELPALGVAPPPWRESPAALAEDLGFHLVYGFATAAALEAFTA
jgi:uncharacterized membrane protein